MSSENGVCDLKGEMDDSGCVQDDSMQNGNPQTNLMDMPDDVLYYILQCCTARDLKALGYSCRRLCRLVQDKTLWRYVDATQDKCSRARLRWLIDNVLQKDTQVLLLTGYARDGPGCLGFVNALRADFEREAKRPFSTEASWMFGESNNTGDMEHIAVQLTPTRTVAERKMFSPHDYWFRRCSGLPTWGDNEVGRSGPQVCIGPQFSLTPELLRDLRLACPKLHTLVLDYCNIDCRNINLNYFPKSLKKLSLRGCRCYNMSMDKSFLFRINAYLPGLETLDVSECDWMDPATLLPLSKLPNLLHLSACHCAKMTEFVAYASLTARYGFKKLVSLDLRGSPVGDSEIAALGWLPSLEKLWLSASKYPKNMPRAHAHFVDDPEAIHIQLHDWEIQVPHMFQERPQNVYYYDVDGMVLNESDREAVKRKSEDGTENGDEKSRKRRKNRQKNCKENRFFVLNLHKITEVISDGEDTDGTDDVHPSTSKGKDDELYDDYDYCYDEDDDDEESSEDETEEKDNNNENNDESQHLLTKEKNKNDLEELKEENLNDRSQAPVNDCEKENIRATIENDNFSDSSNDGENVNLPKPEIGESSKYLDDGEDSSSSSEVETGQCSYSIMKKPIDSDSSDDDDDDDDEDDADDKNEGKAKRKSGYECMKLDGVLNFGEIRCGNRDEVIVFASAKPPKGSKPASKQNGGHVRFRRNEKPVVINGNQNGDNQNDRRKLKRHHDVNQGASTSREPETSEPKPKTSRDNEPPETVEPIDYRIEARHHVLYVNVGPQVNTYRFPREFSSQDLQGIRGFNIHRRHIESSSLVTDFAIRRFGRADGEDVNIIHIGPNGPVVVGQDTGARPDRSNLRFLSVNGYRNITDRSLTHLATAAPHLTHIDFSETDITEEGAEKFRSIRPDCTLIHSKFPEKKW